MKPVLLFLFSCSASLLLAAPTVFVSSFKPADKILPPGTVATFTGKVIAGDELPKGYRIICEELLDGNIIHTRTVKSGEEVTCSRKLVKPGSYAVVFWIVDKNNKVIVVQNKKNGRRQMLGGRGVMVSPDKLKPARPRPGDFDAFWKSRRKLLDRVPVKELERKAYPLPKNLKDKIQAFDVKVACAGSKPVTGVLSMPAGAKEKSLPAVVWFQGAGVYPGQVYAPYAQHVILFDVSAHGISNTQKSPYYEKLKKQDLAGYMHRGMAKRETFYFHDMFLRVMRALDYVKSLPQWNGKMLVVRGQSQGGAQAIVAAALDPQVTLLTATVPAMADHLGPLAKPARQPGWPNMLPEKLDRKEKKEIREIIRTAGYYDIINFASKIRCESHLTAGLIDPTCPPDGVYLVYNAIPRKVKKSIFLHAHGNHGTSGMTAEMIKCIFDHFKEEKQVKK